jgi:Rrf2 family protein
MPSAARRHRVREDACVHISAKVDYAVRAAVELAVLQEGGSLITAERLAEAQSIPRPFLATILQELRRAGVVESKRGVDGGHRLARDASKITLADVIRAVDGPMAAVAGVAPEQVAYPGASAGLREVWIAVRASLRAVLETTTVADVAFGTLPPIVGELIAEPGAWDRR